MSEFERSRGDLPPLVSTNERLNRVFKGREDLLNIEYTLPCVVQQEPKGYFYPLCDEARDAVESGIRTVVPARMAANLSPDKVEQLRVMTSQPESGRVLELDEKVVVEGIPYVISYKGIGATRYIRGEEDLLKEPLSGDFCPEDHRAQLQQYPFYFRWGQLRYGSALSEAAAAIGNRRKWQMDTELPLATARITQIAGQDGSLVPPSRIRYGENNVLYDDLSVITRGQKTSFRISLPSFLSRHHPDAMQAFLSSVLEEYAFYEQKQDVSSEEYFTWLTQKVLSQELAMIFDGIKTTVGGSSVVLARNITTLGEEIDLENMEDNVDDYTFDSLDNFYYHVRKYFRLAEEAVRTYGATIERNVPGSFDMQQMDDVVLEVIGRAVDSEGADTAYRKLWYDGSLASFKEGLGSLMQRAVFHNSHV